MGLGLGLSSSGGGGISVTNKSVSVSASATGSVYTVPRLFSSSSTWQKNSGNANLSIGSSTGAIAAASALGAGNSQFLVIQENDPDGRGAIYKVTLTGQVIVVAPDAPTVTLTPGNGQISVAWTDGATGGASITSHKIYVGGSVVATPTGASPYVITGLTNGTPYTVGVSAVNASGLESPVTSQSATPAIGQYFAFPAVQTKVNAGQRAQIGVIGDSAVAGWGGGVAVGTGSGTAAGSSPNYLRVNAWPQQLRALLAAQGIKTRSDAYFSCSSGTNVTDLQNANPNIALGTGWILGNVGLSGTILQCPNTSTAAMTFTPEVAADSFELVCSAQSGLATIVVSDSSGWSQTVNTADQSGAQVVVGSFGVKRFLVQRPTASTLPISIARNGTGGTVFLQGIIPYDTTNPMLEILNMGWPASRAYGTDGSTPHWNIWAVPSGMAASTPYNVMGVLACDAYIVELGTNDANASIAASDFQTAMTNIATKLKGQAGGNGLNVALVKCRTTVGGYIGYNMSADSLAAIDTVTANLGLSPVINYNTISFVTADRFDGTHLSQSGYAKEATVAKTFLLGA